MLQNVVRWYVRMHTKQTKNFHLSTPPLPSLFLSAFLSIYGKTAIVRRWLCTFLLSYNTSSLLFDDDSSQKLLNLTKYFMFVFAVIACCWIVLDKEPRFGAKQAHRILSLLVVARKLGWICLNLSLFALMLWRLNDSTQRIVCFLSKICVQHLKNGQILNLCTCVLYKVRMNRFSIPFILNVCCTWSMITMGKRCLQADQQ